MEENKNLKYVIDENGFKHYLDKVLGQGGQGIVWKTKDPEILVKMKINSSTGEPIIDEKIYEQYKDELDEVRLIDLPSDIHIAKPISLLRRPYCGYVMRLLNDMKPIKYWIRPFDGETNPVIFYLKTGGLKRRLELLTNTAEIFTKLYVHSAVYADLSPENIFTSDSNIASQVWLIDADNMRYRYDIEKEVMTPHYAAPEVVKGGINTLESDVYSFAILAHEILTMNSPFEGALITDNDEGGWDDEEDYSALVERGELPWIYDPEDDSNRSNTGISGRIVFTPKIKKLFEQTFSKEGRYNPQSRPKIRDWYLALRTAQDLVIECPRCKSTFFLIENNKINVDVECPFCKFKREKGQIVSSIIIDEYKMDNILNLCNQEIQKFNCDGEFEISNISRNDIKQINPIGTKYFNVFDGKYYFYNYHTGDVFFSEEKKETIEIEIENGKYIIKNLSDKPIEIKTKNNTSYGVIKYNQSKKMDSISDIILSMPIVNFESHEQNISDDLINIDDLNKLRVRYIIFEIV